MAILGQITIDELTILSVDADPSASGVAASIGSLAMIDNQTDGKIWIKSGAASTAWTSIARNSTTQLGANKFVFGDANGYLQTTAVALWDGSGRFGFGLNAPVAPQSTLHLDRGTGVGSHIRFTAGTTTGVTAGDGLEVGIDDAGNAEIRNYENNSLNFYTNNTRYVQITAAGQMVVSNNALAAAVSVDSLGTTPIFQIVGSAAFTAQMAASAFSADVNPAVFNLLKSRGALNTQGLLSADDELGRVQFRGSDGVNFQAGASLRAAVDGTAAANSMPGRLLLLTTPSGSVTPLERMRISANGLVRVLDNLQSFRRVWDFTSQATANTTTTLTTASAGVQIFTGTTAGQIVRLPDATTLVNGATYYIKNANTVTTVALQNNAGGALAVIPVGTGTSECLLIDNSTAAGTWWTNTYFDPYYQEVTSTSGMSINSTTDVLITTMTITPPAGIYRVHFEAAVTVGTAGSTLGFGIYVGGSQVASADRPFSVLGGVAPGGGINWYGTTQTVTVNGSQAIEIRGRRSAGTTTVGNRAMNILRVG